MNYTKKADKCLQEWGRRTFNRCEVCGSPEYSCLHHFFTKGSSNNLRYDVDNLIPICNSCHYKHHQRSDPTIHATVIFKRGKQWYMNLVKKKNAYKKVNVKFYKDAIDFFSNQCDII